MKCIICNTKTAFTKNGWFGLIFPLCTKHYHVWVAYGSEIEFNIDSDVIDCNHPENIINKLKDR